MTSSEQYSRQPCKFLFFAVGRRGEFLIIMISLFLRRSTAHEDTLSPKGREMEESSSRSNDANRTRLSSITSDKSANSIALVGIWISSVTGEKERDFSLP